MLFFAVRRGTPLGPHFVSFCFYFHLMQNSIEFQTELLSKKCMRVCVFFVFPSYPTLIQTSSCFSEATTLQHMATKITRSTETILKRVTVRIEQSESFAQATFNSMARQLCVIKLKICVGY